MISLFELGMNIIALTCFLSWHGIGVRYTIRYDFRSRLSCLLHIVEYLRGILCMISKKALSAPLCVLILGVPQ